MNVLCLPSLSCLNKSDFFLNQDKICPISRSVRRWGGLLMMLMTRSYTWAEMSFDPMLRSASLTPSLPSSWRYGATHSVFSESFETTEWAMIGTIALIHVPDSDRASIKLKNTKRKAINSEPLVVPSKDVHISKSFELPEASGDRAETELG